MKQALDADFLERMNALRKKAAEVSPEERARREAAHAAMPKCWRCRDRGRVDEGGRNVPCWGCRNDPDAKLERAGMRRESAEIRASFAAAVAHLRPVATMLERCLGTGIGSLVLHGPVGTGKTWLAGAAARWAIERGWHVEWRKASRVLENLRAAVRDGDGPTEGQVLNSLRRCRLLVLDDLGAHRLTEAAATRLEDLIDDRQAEDAQLVTILPLNYSSPEELREDFERAAPGVGDRLASRLGRRCYRWVEVAGPDMREGE